MCSDLFSSKKNEQISSSDSLEKLANIDQKIEAITNIYYKRFGSDVEIGKKLSDLRAIFEEVFSFLNSGHQLSSIHLEKLNSLETTVNEFEKLLANYNQKEDSPVFDSSLEKPQSLIELILYELKSMDPQIQRVSFSDEVLKGVFWSEQPLMQRAVDLIYRALNRGRQFATDKSGVFSFAHDKTVFKVKITGDAVGAIRLAGFFIDHDFHIVAWSNESSHNEHNSHRLTDQVHRIKDRFLKTGKY